MGETEVEIFPVRQEGLAGFCGFDPAGIRPQDGSQQGIGSDTPEPIPLPQATVSPALPLRGGLGIEPVIDRGPVGNICAQNPDHRPPPGMAAMCNFIVKPSLP
jgi:hypothetical protein